MLTASYTSDINADVAGGSRRGTAYLGRLSALLDADLDRLIGFRSAAAHLSVLQIHGVGASGHFVSNLATVSGIEAEPALRLNQLWLEFQLAAHARLRLGKFPAAQEFFASPTAGFFINSTFGWPASFANDLPSGGPSWPLAAPGVRLSLTANSKLSARIGVFAGDPAGPGHGDPQQRDGHGFNAFGFAGRSFVISEFSAMLPGAAVLTLGGWAHFGRFNDLGGRAEPHRGNFAVYGMVDTPLWKSARVRGRSVSGFGRVGFGAFDRNSVYFYADGGLSLAGPFRGRAGDAIGIAMAYARLSPRLVPRGAAPGELAIETSYRLAIGKRFALQPNVQYIAHPSAWALNSPPTAPPPDALVIGIRTSRTF